MKQSQIILQALLIFPPSVAQNRMQPVLPLPVTRTLTPILPSFVTIRQTTYLRFRHHKPDMILIHKFRTPVLHKILHSTWVHSLFTPIDLQAFWIQKTWMPCKLLAVSTACSAVSAHTLLMAYFSILPVVRRMSHPVQGKARPKDTVHMYASLPLLLRTALCVALQPQATVLLPTLTIPLWPTAKQYTVKISYHTVKQPLSLV